MCIHRVDMDEFDVGSHELYLVTEMGEVRGQDGRRDLAGHGRILDPDRLSPGEAELATELVRVPATVYRRFDDVK